MQRNNDNIVLIGMPGVGKSTAGVLLAKAMSRNFVDTDLVIQSSHDRRLDDLIAELGAAGFCAMEERHVLALDCLGLVIATGGSVIYSDAAMAHLHTHGFTVHLYLPLELLRARLKNLDKRGVVRTTGQNLESLFEERIPLYRRHADAEVNCAQISHESVVERIVELAHARGIQ